MSQASPKTKATSRAVFSQLLPELQARAFLVTGIEDFDTLQRIRDEIAALPAGANWDDVKTRVIDEISPFFIDDTADPDEQEKQRYGAERRAELLLRTHGHQAYAATSYRVMDQQRDVFPYWQYASMGDGKVRDTHRALDGIVLPADSTFWQEHYPPWEFGCRCVVIPLDEEDVAEIRDAEADKPITDRSVLEGRMLDELEQSNRLVRGSGVNEIYNVALKPGGYRWNPGDLRIPVETLRDRYDAPTWRAFQTWAQITVVPAMESTLWSWMNRPPYVSLPKNEEEKYAILPGHTQWRNRTGHQPEPRANSRNREGLVGAILSGRQREGDSPARGLGSASREIARNTAAEIRAVIAGNKPLYHEQLGADAARALRKALAPTLPTGVEIHATATGHLFVYRLDQVRRLPGQERVTHVGIRKAVEEERMGELLGYGANWDTPDYKLVLIFDPQMRVIAGFRAPAAMAAEYAAARAVDYADYLGTTLTFRIAK